MLGRSKTAQAAQKASLRLPGWAWEQGIHRLWILGYPEAADGYTLPAITRAYHRIKPQVPRDNDKANPISRYVRIHPTLAGPLIRDTQFAMKADPNAMATGGPNLTTIQVQLHLDGDPFRVQISSAFRSDGINCFVFLRLGGQGFSQFIPLP